MTREGIKKYLSQRDKAKPTVQMDTFRMEALASILNLTSQNAVLFKAGTQSTTRN
jgi:hypothetical protein